MRDWDIFYNWLNSDPNRAASEYNILRQTLISNFQRKSCADPEGLTDETIERVVKLLPRYEHEPPANPLRFCLGVAKYIHKEYLRKQVYRDGGEASDSQPDRLFQNETEDREVLDQCLHNCLQVLDDRKREIFIRYYLIAPGEKSFAHQSLADQLGISITALRLQILRIKEKLRICITACQQREARF